MSAPSQIETLIETFHNNLEAYRSGRYNETQVRVEYIDPLFMALGWDVHNRQGYAEAYKDVIHEDQIKVAGDSKAPDYCFRIGGARKFFVEAKKPSVDIKHDVHPAYQLRRYAWSAKLPLSIVTDFEEFAVYDCRVKPAPSDKASKARTLYFTYKDYLEKWDEIAAIFARESILKGSFDKYAESSKRKKGTAEVDDAFLEEIESWRSDLARNIALRNPDIAHRDLNQAVQATIDRIIFLRIAEDRGLEQDNQLRALISGDQVYPRLCHLFRNADDRYNSGLFHFRKEPGREGYDNWTLNLHIDDKVLKGIFKRIYYPESPYEFSVLPADILGQVYERFLGKVIRLKGKSAVVEEKPEVRKAGGVYYTPTYIVDYIVKHTVGKLLEGKTPNQVRGTGKNKSPIRVLDPACGSGSFLLGAYQFLLDWYLEQYKQAPEKHLKGKDPRLFETMSKPAPGETEPGVEYRLTTSERKRILTDHIYGVDIDPQAVEVTKLSLLLKVLEGENIETLNKNLQLFHERALPDLANNIQCGNSLIGTDFYQGKQMELSEEEIFRINAFDWEKAFPEVFKGDNPGFDAVIGNPPYVRSQSLDPVSKNYFGEKYSSASKTYDIYVLFVERGLEVLTTAGRLGLILPNKFYSTDYGAGIRELLTTRPLVDRIVDFEDAQVFPQAGTYTNLLFLDKSRQDSPKFAKLGRYFAEKGAVGLSSVLEEERLQWHEFLLPTGNTPWRLLPRASARMMEKIETGNRSLSEHGVHFFQGLKTSADKVYLLRSKSISDGLLIAENGLGEEIRIEPTILKPVVKGEDVSRYHIRASNLQVIYPYQVDSTGRARIIAPETFKERYSVAWSYLNTKRALLGARDKGLWSERPDWYAYARSQNLTAFFGKKILVPYMAKRVSAAVDYGEDRFFVNITTGGYGVKLKTESLSYNLLLAVLNSKLCDWYVKALTNHFRGGYFAINKQALQNFPAPSRDKLTSAQAEQLQSLVERSHDIRSRKSDLVSNHDRNLYQRQIEATDAEIDRLVYELYSLTEEEIRIVEEETQ